MLSIEEDEEINDNFTSSLSIKDTANTCQGLNSLDYFFRRNGSSNLTPFEEYGLPPEKGEVIKQVMTRFCFIRTIYEIISITYFLVNFQPNI